MGLARCMLFNWYGSVVGNFSSLVQCTFSSNSRALLGSVCLPQRVKMKEHSFLFIAFSPPKKQESRHPVSEFSERLCQCPEVGPCQNPSTPVSTLYRWRLHAKHFSLTLALLAASFELRGKCGQPAQS